MFQYSIKRKQSPKFRCVCHSSIQFLSKIKNWKLMSIFYFFKFVIRKNTKVPNRKYLTFFPLGRILKHNAYFYFNPVKNEEENQTERQLYFSDNVAVERFPSTLSLGRECWEIFLLAISSPRSVFFVELLQDPLCTQHWSRSYSEKRYAINTNFPLPPPF